MARIPIREGEGSSDLTPNPLPFVGKGELKSPPPRFGEGSSDLTPNPLPYEGRGSLKIPPPRFGEGNWAVHPPADDHRVGAHGRAPGERSPVRRGELSGAFPDPSEQPFQQPGQPAQEQHHQDHRPGRPGVQPFAHAPPRISWPGVRRAASSASAAAPQKTAAARSATRAARRHSGGGSGARGST